MLSLGLKTPPLPEIVARERKGRERNRYILEGMLLWVRKGGTVSGRENEGVHEEM